MRSVGRIFCFVLALASLESFAQSNRSYQDVSKGLDSLLAAKKWEDLTDFAKVAEKEGHQSYKISLYKGIGFYHRECYYAAESAFDQSVRMNPMDTVAGEYLYWCQNYNGNWRGSRLQHEELTAAVKNRIEQPSPRIISGIGMTGGIGFSSDKSVTGNYRLLGVSLSNEFGKRFLLDHSFYRLSQRSGFSDVVQWQYRFAPGVQLTKELSVTAVGNYYHDKSEYGLSYVRDTVYRRMFVTPIGQQVRQDSVVHKNISETDNRANAVFSGSLMLTYRKGRVAFSTYGTVFTGSTGGTINRDIETTITMRPTINGNPLPEGHPPGSKINEELKISEKHMTWQSGFGIGYVLPPGRDFLTLGVKIHFPDMANRGKAIFSPNLTARIGRKVWLNAEYLEKGAYYFADMGSPYIFSRDAVIKSRFNVGCVIFAGESTGITVNFLNDRLSDAIGQYEYKNNSILIGLNFKL